MADSSRPGSPIPRVEALHIHGLAETGRKGSLTQLEPRKVNVRPRMLEIAIALLWMHALQELAVSGVGWNYNDGY
jgi:hypothetical protein